MPVLVGLVILAWKFKPVGIIFIICFTSVFICCQKKLFHLLKLRQLLPPSNAHILYSFGKKKIVRTFYFLVWPNAESHSDSLDCFFRVNPCLLMWSLGVCVCLTGSWRWWLVSGSWRSGPNASSTKSWAATWLNSPSWAVHPVSLTANVLQNSLELEL